MPKKYVLYCHTNKINGKRYIGITHQKPEKRWLNGKGYLHNEHFYRAIQKYGWHNFSHDILYTDLSEKEAEQLEVKLIKEYDCCNPRKGYNIYLGGNSGHKFTEESKQKLSNALKGVPKSEEHKRKLSEAKKGSHVSDETKKKISKATKGENNPMYGRKRDIKDYKTKAVMCVETSKIYISTCEAARKLNIDQGSISKVCNKKLKTAGNLHWRFVDFEEV